MTKRDFWKSAGLRLLEVNDDGWLNVTPEFLRAYYSRPEVHPVEESCDAELRRWHRTYRPTFSTSFERESERIIDSHLAPFFGDRDLR